MSDNDRIEVELTEEEVVELLKDLPKNFRIFMDSEELAE
ncbi:MAG: hypothetical protein K0R55_2872 [Sporomusa sp.]|jgi:hypothetical protein|nr:hypothetical protein [Sporomusa sp.]